jgi:hypothetical protein
VEAGRAERTVAGGRVSVPTRGRAWWCGQIPWNSGIGSVFYFPIGLPREEALASPTASLRLAQIHGNAVLQKKFALAYMCGTSKGMYKRRHAFS